MNAVNWNFFFIWWRFRRWFLSYVLSWKWDENWARVEMFFEQIIKVMWRDFDSSEFKLEDEIDSRFKKTSIFFKVTLNTSMSLTWTAWSKLQTFNLTMSSCIKDQLNWSAWRTTKVLKKEKFQHLIFNEYSFWMTWRIRLEASCFRRKTRLNEICFLWMNWVLIDFSWANGKLYCFLWADEKLSYFFQVNEKLNCFLQANWKLNCFFQVNEKLDCFLWANWKLSCFFQVNEKLDCFLRANWKLSCFFQANEKLNCFLQANWMLNCFLWTICRLNCFLWVNWERGWRKATLLTSSEKFSSCWLKS